MNGCGEVQAGFTDYLDGRLNGREMQLIGAHLNDCRECAREWASLRETQRMLAELGPVPEPEDLPLRIRVAVSQERARSRRRRLRRLEPGLEEYRGPVPAAGRGGICQRGAAAGHDRFSGDHVCPAARWRRPAKDEPLGNPTAPRLLSLSSGAGNNQISACPARWW